MAARTLPQTKHTIVQHSGFGYGGDHMFAKGLETRRVATVALARKIEQAGGLLFDSYAKAEDFAEAAMYPPDNSGLIPSARGTFAGLEVDGLALYIPVREVVG